MFSLENLKQEVDTMRHLWRDSPIYFCNYIDREDKRKAILFPGGYCLPFLLLVLVATIFLDEVAVCKSFFAALLEAA